MNEKYPVVTDIVPSQNTATVLKNLLYSQDGILTLHLSYMYQSWQQVEDKALRDYLKKLADNDGAILDAFGNLTVAFGGDPNFCTSNGKYWTVQYLITTKNKEQFLKNAILMEQRAIRDLENAITKVDNASLKTLLSSIMADKQNIVRDLNNFI